MSLQPRYDQDTEGHVYDVTPLHQTESVSEIMSEAASTMSGVTIQSDEVEDFFVTHNGRKYPASENVPHWMPSDNPQRDILRHVVEKIIFDGNYPGRVRDILYSKDTLHREYQVLEIGTRTGTWVQEMATEFPHIQFRSLDVAPIMAHTPRGNIVFEVYDLTEEGFMLQDNTQDVVFIHGGVELVKNYRALLRETHRVLRPGGLIYTRELDLGLWNRDNINVLARATNPAGCLVFDLMRVALTKCGVDSDTCVKVHRWLAPDSDLWADSGDSKGFEDINSRIRTVHLNPHPGHPCAAHLPPHVVPWICHLHDVCARDVVGMICDAGLTTEEATKLAKRMIDESKDPKNCPVLKWHVVYATKPHYRPRALDTAEAMASG